MRRAGLTPPAQNMEAPRAGGASRPLADFHELRWLSSLSRHRDCVASRRSPRQQSFADASLIEPFLVFPLYSLCMFFSLIEIFVNFDAALQIITEKAGSTCHHTTLHYFLPYGFTVRDITSNGISRSVRFRIVLKPRLRNKPCACVVSTIICLQFSWRAISISLSNINSP